MTLASQKRIQPLEPEWVRYLSERLPGETPGPNDDFFRDTSVYGSAVTISGSNTTVQERGWLSMDMNSQSAGDLAGRVAALVSASAPITIETRVTMFGTQAVTSAGIGFTNGSTGTDNILSAMVFIALGTSYGWRARYGTLNNVYATTNTTVGVDAGSAGSFWAAQPLYLRAIWVTTNTFKAGYRVFGAPWLYSGNLTPTFTPTSIALFGSTDGTAATPSRLTFDYIRATPLDLSA